MTRRAWLIVIVLALHGGGAVTVAANGRPAQRALTPLTSDADLEALKRLFRRPVAVAPADSPDLIALGARLFREPRLSSDHKLSCASCHVPERGFTDGRRTASGKRGRTLPRNTPALWNLAQARALYWDARVPTLEAQVEDAVERDAEMDSTLAAAARWLALDPTYPRQFQRASLAFDGPAIATSIAAYQRSIASPPTRFDRWVEGDATALSRREVDGFRVFTGPGRCVACHGGWRFTDDRLHDIGLPTRGRIAPDGSRRVDWKTPSLREARWTAPYFHDGRARSLERVVAYYAGRPPRRPTLAPIMRTPISLSRRERADLVAFVMTLSSGTRPRAP